MPATRWEHAFHLGIGFTDRAGAAFGFESGRGLGEVGKKQLGSAPGRAPRAPGMQIQHDCDVILTGDELSNLLYECSEPYSTQCWGAVLKSDEGRGCTPGFVGGKTHVRAHALRLTQSPPVTSVVLTWLYACCPASSRRNSAPHAVSASACLQVACVLSRTKRSRCSSIARVLVSGSKQIRLWVSLIADPGLPRAH